MLQICTALVLARLAGVLASQVPLQQDSGDNALRLVRYGPGVNDTTRVQAVALDALVGGASPFSYLDVDASLVSALAARQGAGPGFIDLTDVDLNLPKAVVLTAPYPTPNATKYPEIIEDMFPLVSATGLGWTIGNLSQEFSTRYYKSLRARDPALWLSDRFVEAVGKDNVAFLENKFNQPNVIAAIPRAEGSTNDEVIVIGGHFDSTSPIPWLRAPGADDDASGVSVILQTMQILNATGFRGARRIEAHAYAGEEGGLLGSVNTAAQYAAKNASVRAMLQFEMIGYQPTDMPVISMTIDTAPELQTFVSALVKTYIPKTEATFRTTVCGYGCSDHDSWTQSGYSAICLAAAGPRDPELNPHYHSTADTLDKLNMTKASVFVKAALAFVVELSEKA
ncbi:Zn-dependent exopeptidase [Exidia glandulosa HHB12029]|uniref:Peptide hydrolase n=1 Tax=Exidia glandulosa HHB12029 TaxID=1314781 RepID=A0A165DY78_EXIGL|nr:Zn-dependent exopeptidase [Exidia glandulosa HHB12029]